MKVEQIYTGCLAQGAYYIESNGEAAIIDPLREVQPYIDMASKRGAKIKYIFETHFHADFVSGHKDLAEKTDATIVYGPTTMKLGFDAHVAEDNEIFKLGNVEIKLIHTPGHTLESSCYLLYNEESQEESIFTGDTLFIGDVGRPDLAQKIATDLTQEKLASMMFDSLRNKIIPLPDHITVYPAHGAGSACGKNMSNKTSDSLGNQKKTNYALNTKLTREEFIKGLTTGLTPPPGYFPENVLMNIQGYNPIDEVISNGTRKLSITEFEAAMVDTNTLIIDTRNEKDFVKGFIPGSLFIGLDGSFAVWAGTLIKDINQKILLIADKGREEEAVTRLARVGYDNTIGYLDGGIESWKEANKSIDTIKSVSPEQAFELMNKENLTVLDVRKVNEHTSEHILGAKNIPLDYFDKHLTEIKPDENHLVHCAGGYRSVIFTSILKAKGYNNLINIEKGFKGIQETGLYNISAYVCPTTLA